MSVPATITVLHGTVVLPDRLVPDGAVVLEGERVRFAGPRAEWPVPGAAPEPLPPGTLLLPGLVDIHCHGGAGAEFGADQDASRRAAAFHHRGGSTSVVASLVSAPPLRLIAGMRTCAALVADGTVAAVHTEGPFLSAARRGAQDPAALTAVDPALVDALAEAAAGRWSAMTFAPELTGAAELVTRLAAARVLPAIGHTDADAATTAAALHAAVQAGRRPLVTHLFNGMRPMHHRDPGPVAAALSAAARGTAAVELIADGVHLADATVAMVMDVAGPGSVVLVSDATAAAGMPAGRYLLGGLEVQVEGTTARLVHGDSLAGGAGTLLDIVRRCVRHAGVPLLDAVASASATPAAVLGLDTEVGALAAGLRADVVAVDPDLRPIAVWRAGRRIEP